MCVLNVILRDLLKKKGVEKRKKLDMPVSSNIRIDEL